METWHRVSFGHKDKVDTIIESLNLKTKRSPLPRGGYIIHIDITESDPEWPKISKLIEEKDGLDIYDTNFTDSEILDAEWVRLIPVFERGFPQPQNGWEKINYEEECPTCGVGYRQTAPFRLKGEPRLGKNHFLGLYWTYTLFCVQEVINVLEAHNIQGYEVWPAIIHKTNQASKIVSQLIFPHVAAPALADEDKLQPEQGSMPVPYPPGFRGTCPLCGITKYEYHKRGYMHLKREALIKDTDFQLTYEWFGSGGYGGNREILISHSVAKLIIDKKWRGVRLKPIKLI